jgi:hypothetical protein
VHWGEDAALEAASQAREAMRWPGVALLVVLGLGSILGAVGLMRHG